MEEDVKRITGLIIALFFASGAALAQDHAPGEQGSSNVHIVAHVPSGGEMHVGDIEIEQELSRPYAYVSLALSSPVGFNILDLKVPSKPRQVYSWRIENPELHLGLGALRGRYFKVNGRYYYAQCFQFFPGGPDADLGLVVFDVTGLPDSSKVKEVTRIKAPYAPGGFHDLYAYKHSNGQVYVFTSVAGKPYANVFDAQKMVSGGADGGLISKIPNPGATDANGGGGYAIVGGYHDYFVGYDPATHQDKFYGAGPGGYYVFDVSDVMNPKMLTSVTGVAGITSGHTFTPTPDGRYAVAETEYQYAPLRIFDLKPGLGGTVQTVCR